MKILCFDTSGDFCSVLVSEDEDVLFYQSDNMKWGHGAALHPLIAHAMQKSDITLKDIDCFGVNVGPGGFTGVRVAVASAKALALASHRPLIGITGFELLFEKMLPEKRGEKNFIVLESRRDEKFVKVFSKEGDVLHDAFCAHPLDIKKQLSGDVRLYSNCLIEGLDVELMHINIHHMPRLVLEHINSSQICDVSPLYIRPPDVHVSKS